MRIANKDLIDSTVNLVANFTSDGFFLGHIVNYSIQAVFNGTPDGTFTLECSNDMGSEDRGNGGWNSSGVTNWTEIGGSSSIVTGADTIVWDVQNAGYRWVRVKWTVNASNGNLLSLVVNAKGV